MTLGAALAQSGERDAALAAFGRARGADPSSAMAAYNLGAAHLTFGEKEPARAAFEAALVLEIDRQTGLLATPNCPKTVEAVFEDLYGNLWDLIELRRQAQADAPPLSAQ